MRVPPYALGFCLCVSSVAAFSQAPARKPGLWEITTTMTLQQSPFPPGMTPPADSPLSPAPRTRQVCLTQEHIDKFGAPVPAANGCKVINVERKPTGMTAELVCDGRTKGKGTVESTWTDSEHAKGSVHFTGTVQAGPRERPLEWTTKSTSVYKGAECGSVAPEPMAEK